MSVSEFEPQTDAAPDRRRPAPTVSWVSALDRPGLAAARPPGLARRLGQAVRQIAANPVDRLAVVITLVTSAGLWALGRAHVVSREPLWLWVTVLLSSLMITFAGELRWRSPPSAALAHFRIGLQVAVITVIMYMTGWGPVLGVGYIVIVRDLTIQMGARYWRTLAL